LSDAELIWSSCPLLLRCFTDYASIVTGLGGGVGASVGIGVGVGATTATLHPQLALVQVIEKMICCLDGVFFEATNPASAWLDMFPIQQM
jgi:hypothetical protein